MLLSILRERILFETENSVKTVLVSTKGSKSFTDIVDLFHKVFGELESIQDLSKAVSLSKNAANLSNVSAVLTYSFWDSTLVGFKVHPTCLFLYGYVYLNWINDNDTGPQWFIRSVISVPKNGPPSRKHAYIILTPVNPTFI